MTGFQVLAISDDQSLISILRGTLEIEGTQTICYPTTDEALDALKQGSAADLLLLDAPRRRWKDRLITPELFRFIDKERVAILVEAGDSAWTQYAQQLGVRTLLSKPLLRHDIDQWLAQTPFTVQTPPAAQTPFSDNALQPSADASDGCLVEELDNGRFFLAACPSMRQIYSNIRLLAPVDVPVLVLGESGVGKEIVSLLLHKHSLRSARTYTDVNCAALPPDLLESELFGYEAGAFTGAVKAKPGRFEMAHRGTLLLDEIGEMSAPMQAKLLHVLQDGHFCRLGARSSMQVDVRVLAATNINMEEAIADRRFREDLYYRLSAFSIQVPALRERREEIPYLLREIVRRSAVELNRPPFELYPDLLTSAQEYDWPGNLRELRNFVTRRLVLRDEKSAASELRAKTKARNPVQSVPVSAFPEEARTDNMRSIIKVVKNQAEKRMIEEALRASGWNRRRAAVALSISYRALLYKIQQYELAQTNVRSGPDRLTLTN